MGLWSGATKTHHFFWHLGQPLITHAARHPLPSRRAAVRCGTGLFVTDDLLRTGYSMVSLVSLRHSLAGMAMKQGQAFQMRVPNFGSPAVTWGPAATRTVACVPITIAAPGGTDMRPLQVGAFLLGCTAAPVDAPLGAGIERLASAAGPALLTVRLGRVKHFAYLLSLRDHDLHFVGAEEDMQDLPVEINRPPGGYGGGAGPPTQPLCLPSAQPTAASRQTSCEEAVRPAPAHSTSVETPWLPAVKPAKAAAAAVAPTVLAGVDDGAAACQTPLELTPLLTFVDPSQETAYTAAKAMAAAPADAALSAVHLLVMLCLLWLSRPLAEPHVWAALMLSALLPLCSALAAMAGDARWYPRWREALLVGLVGVQIAALGF